MKKVMILILLAASIGADSQDMSKFNIYKPDEDAKQTIGKLVKEAKETNKHVLIQVGGNWCVWCARFDDMVTKDKGLDSSMKANYVVYHLNYSKENKNIDLMEKYQYPQRFGFPVFLILNEKGELLHTQNSWYLESAKTYDREKVKSFFEDWGKNAFDPATYKEQ